MKPDFISLTCGAGAALFLLAACSSPQTAPISYGGSPPTPEAPAPNRAVSADAPLAAFALQPEEVQPFDPTRLPRTHHVSDNESLYDVATRYQVPLLALIEQNGLEPPYQLAAGQQIELPPPRLHIAEAGESFVAIAQRYSVDTRSLALLNRLTLPHEVRPGERIVLPALAGERTPAAARPAPDLAPALPPRAAAGDVRFRWPLRGAVRARFGAQVGGGRLDGVEIAGREGASILAAAEGDVVYAGADLPGYGTLVLVRHADTYVTAYGYGRRALVREGQHVRAGQPLAELGGREGGARLLFQVRRGREALDPLPLLGAP